MIEERESETDEFNTYRDNTVHVMREKCTTCIYRPGNLMHLKPGRLKAMSDNTKATGVPVTCHQTLPYNTEEYVDYYKGSALCAGDVEANGEYSIVMRLANMLGIIKYVEPKH